MSLRRLAVIVLSAVATVLVAAVLYLAFGDLSQHKGRIEALVTRAARATFRDRRGVRAQSAALDLCGCRARAPGKRGLGFAAADGRDRARVGAGRPLVAGLGTRRRPLVRIARRLRPARDERRRQRQLGVRRGGRAQAGCGAARREARRGASRHRERQARQCADHLSRARQAGPGSADRDAEHRPRFRWPARHLRERQPERVPGCGERRAGAPGCAHLRAKHPRGDAGHGGRPASRRQRWPRAPRSPGRSRSGREGRASGYRQDAQEAPAAGRLGRPSDRRRAAEGRRRPHPARPRRQARRHQAQGWGHAPRARPARIGPADRGLGSGCGAPGGGVRRDRFAGWPTRGRRPLCLLAQGNHSRRGEREIRRRNSAGERNSPPGPRTERRPALRARRREPGQAAAGAAGDLFVHERQLRRQSRQARGQEPQGPNRARSRSQDGRRWSGPAGSAWTSSSPRPVWI